MQTIGCFGLQQSQKAPAKSWRNSFILSSKNHCDSLMKAKGAKRILLFTFLHTNCGYQSVILHTVTFPNFP